MTDASLRLSALWPLTFEDVNSHESALDRNEVLLFLDWNDVSLRLDITQFGFLDGIHLGRGVLGGHLACFNRRLEFCPDLLKIGFDLRLANIATRLPFTRPLTGKHLYHVIPDFSRESVGDVVEMRVRTKDQRVAGDGR